MKKHVYSFGGGTADGDGKMKDTLGGKGAGLAEMSRANVPVPPGFTISTEVCNIYFENKNQVPAEIDAQMLDALGSCSKSAWAQKLGDTDNPLLVSVRSGAKFSMPGMMDTILNLGLNDETVAAHDSQERQSALRIRLLPPLHPDVRRTWCSISTSTISTPSSTAARRKAKRQVRYRPDGRRSEGRHRRLQEAGAEERPAKPFPQDAMEQLSMARDAVFRSWLTIRANHYRKMNNIPDDLGTAVNVQAMVFGNLGDTSATGVGFTRNPVHRREDVLRRVPDQRAGRRRGGRHPHAAAHRRTEEVMPDVYDQLARSRATWKSTIATCRISSSPSQDGKLYMLQTRNGKRTGPAAVRIAVDMVEEGLINKKESGAARGSAAARSVAAPGARSEAREEARDDRQGSAGLARRRGGHVVFTADQAVMLARSRPVILVRAETVPDDIHGMEVAKGILTARGGMTSHAAVVARGMGMPLRGRRRRHRDQRAQARADRHDRLARPRT